MNINRLTFLGFIGLFFSISISFNCLAQKSDYIATDSTISYAVKLKDGGRHNYNFIRVEFLEPKYKAHSEGRQEITYIRTRNGGVDKTFFPEDLVEYGFKGGSSYYSAQIEINGEKKWTFLKKLINGKMKLFQFIEGRDSYFFIQNGTSEYILVEESNKEVSEESLHENFNVSFFKADSLRQPIRYRKVALKKLVNLYNFHQSDKQMPPSKFYVFSAYSVSGMTYKKGVSSPIVNYHSNNHFSLGLSRSFPISISNFDIRAELFFSVGSYHKTIANSFGYFDYNLRMKTVSLPVLLQYTLKRTGEFQPYVFGGAQYTRSLEMTQLNYETTYNATLGKNAMSVVTDKSKLGGIGLMGGVLGAGITHPLGTQNIHDVSLEVRVNKMLRLSDKTTSMFAGMFLVSYSF